MFLDGNTTIILGNYITLSPVSFHTDCYGSQAKVSQCKPEMECYAENVNLFSRVILCWFIISYVTESLWYNHPPLIMFILLTSSVTYIYDSIGNGTAIRKECHILYCVVFRINGPISKCFEIKAIRMAAIRSFLFTVVVLFFYIRGHATDNRLGYFCRTIAKSTKRNLSCTQITKCQDPNLKSIDVENVNSLQDYFLPQGKEIIFYNSVYECLEHTNKHAIRVVFS